LAESTYMTVAAWLLILGVLAFVVR
jgi:hypothetical protein